MNRRIITLLAVFAMLATLLAVPAGAVEAGTVSFFGTVYDGTDDSLVEGLAVTARTYDDEGQPEAEVGASTDVDGAYQLDVPQDRWVELLFTDPDGQRYGFGVYSTYSGGDEQIDWWVYPGGVVNGLVHDASGAPIEGATVEGYYGVDPVMTGPDGRFEYPYPYPEGQIYIDVFGPEGSDYLYASADGEILAGTPTDFDITLERPGAITGTVTDEATGSPIDYGSAEVIGPLESCDYCFEVYGLDFDGTYYADRLVPGSYLVRFQPYDPSFAAEFYDGAATRAGATPVVVLENDVTAGIDASLAAATVLRGQVEAFGTPITDGVVTAFVGGTAPEDEVSSWHLCCGDSSFDFTSLPEGTYFLRYDGIGGEHWYGPTGEDADAVGVTTTIGAPVDVVLEIDGVGFVEGTTQTSVGDPAETVPVADVPVVFADDLDSVPYLEPLTGPDGSFRVAVTAGVPGFLVTNDEFSHSFYTSDPTPVNVAEGATINVTIDLVAGLGVPLPDSGLSIPGSAETFGVPTLANGEDLTVVWDGCTPGFGEVYTENITTYDSTYIGLEEDPPGTHTGTLAGGTGPGATSLQGTVYCDDAIDEFAGGVYVPVELLTVDRDGAPLEDVTATLRSSFTGDLAERSALLGPVTPSPTQVTGSDGVFGWLLRSGDYFDLTLESDGCVVELFWLEAAYDLRDNVFEVDCGPLPQDAPGIWGVVRDDDTFDPLADMTVALLGSMPDGDYGVIAEVTTGPDGVYAFGADVVDSYESYSVYGYDPTEQRGAYQNGAWVEEGVERADLFLSPEASVVSGTVTSLAGPVEGAKIYDFGLPITTAPDGTYRSIALPRGSFAYWYVEPPFGSDLYDAWGEVELSDQEVAVDVYLESPGSVSGTVSDGSGARLQGIIVSSSAFGQVTTAADGTYLAPKVHPGDNVDVQFFDPTGTYAYEWYDDQPSAELADRITVVEGQQTSGIDANLGLGSSIVGTVSAVGGLPISSSHVELWTADGERFVASSQTAADGSYAFPGLQAGSYLVIYNDIVGPWFSGNTDVAEDAVPVTVDPGESATSNLTVPGIGFVAGTVTEGGNPVVGASVNVDDYRGYADSGAGGTYRIPVKADRAFRVDVYAGQFYEDASASGLTVGEGAVLTQDFALVSRLPGGTVEPRPGTSVKGSRSTSGIPTLGPDEPLEVTVTSCEGGIATFDVVEVYPGSSTAATGVAMVEEPAGTYVGTAGPFTPGHVYEVQIHIDCPGDEPDDDSSFGLYIDPAGTIVDTNGVPIDGATATLYRSDDEGGPYTVVPDGSTIMSPENRTNPDVVGADGVFQWLTIEGWYKVRAEKVGCKDPDSAATFVETPELPVPPEQVGLILTLDCGEIATGTPDTTLTTGPSGTVASRTSSFAFTATETGSTFECKLDGADWASCTSPKSTTVTTDGLHTFQVRARKGDLVDATPASRTWSVDATAPDTTLSGGPTGTVTTTSASFTLGSEGGTTFSCRLDAGAWAACTSPKSYSGLAAGSHTFEARATDAVGNVDASPASRTWTVKAATPTPKPSFSDTDESIFRDDIAKLAASGITKGCNPPKNTKFCPDAFVTRGQMAAFLNRALSFPAGTKGTFSDSKGNTFETDIVALAKAGVTKGCNPPKNTKFCPDDRVTRGQMAAFLNRALSLSAGTKGGFSDSKGNTFEADIAALAKAGITKGCNPPKNTKFCPDAFVTRGQMAAFLVRAGLTD